MAGVVVLVLVLTTIVPVFATDYTVGDTQGWTQGVDYTTWAATKTFNVGDGILFQYGFLHSVDEVGKSDYDACSSSNTLQSFTDQNTKITLSALGPRYFICGTSGHCTAGMKLAVTAVAASTTPTTPSTPSPSDGSTTSPSTTPIDGSTTSPSTLTPSDGSTMNPSTPTLTPSVPSGSTPWRNSPSTMVNSAIGSGFIGGRAMILGALVVGLAIFG